VSLADQNHRQLFIPEGVAHGFAVLSETALFFYKCAVFYAPVHDRGMHYADPDIAVRWPVSVPLVSKKDRALAQLKGLSPRYIDSSGCVQREISR